ncbi:DNA-binding CsgD family transcriptional regulator/tetratricopeptide (TPR) repeat protein [Paraburkholderia sp. GAS41]|jgi:DNA-binding CsgD family transcriptional regulator/tetratricopeptide (TPR) repeat protein|uniref:helix-turn-helix transcriptional regulator n=1 Tax=Paraburkholderia sp. GAS41 TaxID=3035134 RepID=UPI003D20AB7C
MECSFCRRDNREDARFCDACGTRLAATVEDREAETSIVGRESELAALAGLLGRMAGGRGAIAMLAGEPGIGKSHTAQMLARRAAGVRVLWGRCNEEPGAPPYWPWLQIMRVWLEAHDDEALRAMLAAAAPIADVLPEIWRRLGDQAPLLPTSDPLQQRFRLFDAIASFWRLAAAREPLLLIIDNLHWADASSLRLLEFLAPEIGDNRILLLATYRDIELNRQHPLSVTLGDLARYSYFHRLRLGGLSRRETEVLIARSGGNGFTPALLDAIYEQTEGNPLFVAETTRLLIQEGVLGRRTHPSLAESCAVRGIHIPEGVKEVIGRRLNRLSPMTNLVLERAALIGRTFDLRLLQRVLDEPAANGIQSTIEEALRSRIVEPEGRPGWFQFSHAVIRETLYDEIAIPARSGLHLDVAQAIEGLYADEVDQHLPALAHHYTCALPGADATRAADIARRAAERATGLLAHEEAARYYRLALQAAGMTGASDPALKCRLLNALGDSLTFAGEYLQAREAFEQAMLLARNAKAIDEMTRAALGFERATWAPGLPGQAATRLLREALAALDNGDGIMKAQLLSSLARALIFSGEDAQAEIVHEQAVAMARRCGDTGTLVSTLVSTLSTRWQPERSAQRLHDIEEALRLAENSNDVLRALDAQAWQLFELMELGDLSTWRVRLEQFERRAADLRQPFESYVAATSRATFALMEGRFDVAERLIEQALQIGRRMPGLDAPGVYGMQMFTLRSEQGRLRELAPLVRVFVNATPKAGTWRPGLALLYSEIGLLAEARNEFEELAADGFAIVRHDALRAASLAYLAQVCARLDDKDRAEALYSMLFPYDGRNVLIGTTVGCLGAASSLLGLLATTRRNWHDAQRHFESALAMNLRQGAAPAVARTRLHYASMRLARNDDGDIDAARVLLQDARAAAECMDMRALLTQIDDMLGSTTHGSSPACSAGLSTRETEVLVLVSSGLGNREIADRLFLSPNTVANHIRAVLAKTHSANRTEAAAFAIRNGLTER